MKMSGEAFKSQFSFLHIYCPQIFKEPNLAKFSIVFSAKVLDVISKYNPNSLRLTPQLTSVNPTNQEVAQVFSQG